MVKVNEIRVGNIFIGYDDKLFSWGLKEFSFIEPDVAIDIDEIIKSPVVISEEILLKVGFEHDHLEERFNFYGTNGCHYIVEQQDDWFFVGIKNSKSINYFVWDIKYLHQLQNLYLALTGQELNTSTL